MAKLKFVEKPGKVIKHSSSLRFIELTVGIMVIDILATVVPLLAGYSAPDNLYIQLGAPVLGAVLGSAGWVARLIAQNSLKP